MSEPVLELEWELDKDRKKAARKRIKRLRKRMVMGSYFPKGILKRVEWLFPSTAPKKADDAQDDQQNERAQIVIHKFFSAVTWTALGSLALLMVAAALEDGVGEFIFRHRFAGVGIGLLGSVFLLLIMFDFAIYRPRIFSLCSRSPTRFFHSISVHSPTLKKHLRLIAKEKPDTWKRVKELENGLRAEAVDFLSLEGIRLRLILRVLHRLGGVVASLALLGYGLAAAVNTGVLVTCSESVKAGCAGSGSVPEYGYFSLDAFFTGFSDVGLVHAPAGYGYLTVVAVTFTVIVYFVFTEVISSQNEFHANFRASAESFVLQHSEL